MDFFESLLKIEYDNKVAWFNYLNQNIEKGGILFVGDSLTAEFMITELLHNKTSLPVYNRGIGGDTTLGLLNRMSESVYDVAPSKIFLLIGINDLANPDNKAEQTSKNIEKIVNHIKAQLPSSKINLISLYPINESDNPKIDKNAIANKSNQKIMDINSMLKDITVTSNVNYVDMHSHLIDETGNVKIEYTREGLHLTPTGYSVVLQTLLPLINN